MAENETDFSYGLRTEANDDVIRAFARHCLNVYKEEGYKDETLDEYFADDFSTFSLNNFVGLPLKTKRDLRDFLRKNGVYVSKGRGVVIPHALHEAAHEVLKWPEDDKERPGTSNAEQRETTKKFESNAEASPIRNTGQKATGIPAVVEVPEQHNLSERRKAVDSARDTRNMGNIQRVYNRDEERFSGKPEDNFDRKVAMFNERCMQSGLHDSDKPMAFSIMLTGRALQFYFDYLQGKNMDFFQLCASVKARFITAEHTRALIREWDSISLRYFMSKGDCSSSQDYLEKLITRLQDIQSALPIEYRSEEILRNKLLNAVKDVDACRLAYFKPASTLQGLIEDIHASLAAHSTPQSATPHVHFVDRKFKGAHHHSSRPSNYTQRSSNRTCIVCKQKNCWSTNHSPAERIRALRQNRPLRQFMASIEKDESDGMEDEIEKIEELAAHVMNIQDDDKKINNAPEIISTDDEDNNTAFLACIRNTATSHALTMQIGSYRYTKNYFYGVMVDTGCAPASTGGLYQYQAYCRHVGLPEAIDTNKSIHCMFGLSGAMSVGTAIIQFPVENIIMTFKCHIIDDDLPLLLSVTDMDRLGVYFNNLQNMLKHPSSGSFAKINRHFEHPFITWDPTMKCFFTEIELRRLHKSFGHPHPDKLFNLLKKADFENTNSETRKLIESITNVCKPCQEYAQKPRRFKFTLSDDKEFNHTVFIDIFYIESKPVLHVVDQSTRYQAARWLPKVTSESVWRALRMCWIDIYLGPPDVITHDAGKQFISRMFQANSDMLHISTKQVPVESANSMSFVERYHVPVRRAYKIIRQEAPDITADECLQMAVKSVNDSAGPDGLVPTLLVYGCLPRLGLPNDMPTPGTFRRATALRKATTAMSKIFARSQVSSAVRTRNGPDTSDIHSAPLGCKVLVYRPELDKWDGPYDLLEVNGETCTVLLEPPAGPTKFRSTVVKRYLTEQNRNLATDAMMMTINSDFDVQAFTARQIRQSSDHKKYAASRQKEVDCLMQRGVFSIAKEIEAKGLRIYGSRFIDHMKNEGTPEAFEKSRLVVQGFNDKHEFLTHSPTVQRASQRLIMALAPCDPEMFFIIRDVSQAFVQSETSIKRPIFVRPPSILGYPPGTLFRVNRPLYGIPEAGIHWFLTYHRYHMNKLNMHPSIYDMCLLYTKGCLSTSSRSQNTPRGIVCLQTNDTAYIGNRAFVDKEEKMRKQFDSKNKEILTNGGKLEFNGGTIKKCNNEITLVQPKHIHKLSRLDEKSCKHDDFVSERARGSYIAAVCRPELSYAFSSASQITAATTKDVKQLNKGIYQATKDPNRGLKFVKLDLDSICMALFVDAGFATNQDMSSQIGFIIFLMDKHSRMNIVHYGSSKSKRVTRSVLAAELFSLVHGFDAASVLRLALNDMLDHTIPLHVYTDSRSLYDCLTKIGRTSEKRLLIDLCMLRQNYERREISEVYWIPTAQNPADSFTKFGPGSSLSTLIDHNHLALSPNAWVERSNPSCAENPNLLNREIPGVSN